VEGCVGCACVGGDEMLGYLKGGERGEGCCHGGFVGFDVLEGKYCLRMICRMWRT